MEKLAGDGPYLLIANHNIGAGVEIFALMDRWCELFGEERAVYGMTHSFVFRLPVFRSVFPKYGSIPATQEAGLSALRAGYSVLLFPGGAYEATRPYSRRRECDFAGRRGWIRLARESGAKVVPIAISGSHAVNPVLFRSRLLSRALLLPWYLGVKWIPVSVAQLVFGGVFGSAAFALGGAWAALAGGYLGFTFTPLIALLPGKIKIDVLDPIVAPETDAQRDEDFYRQVVGAIGDRLRKIT